MSLETRNGREDGLVDTLNNAIRDNPLAAGLIGAGVCWMLFSKVKPPALGGITEAVKSAADSVGAAASAGGSSVASAAGKASSHIAEAAGQVKEAASDALSKISPSDAPSIADAGEAIRAGFQSSVDAGTRYGGAVQQTLSENLQRQPLLLGALGLAIGAGIASAFASTRIENELMGEQGSAARATLQKFAEETKDFAATRAREVLDAVKDEAQAKDLTPEAAKDAFQNLSKKAKDVAGAAGQAVINRTS